MADADVVVIGAGISGLSVAWNLERCGLRVIVIEAAARAGGTIGTVREGGCLVECGPNSTLETSPLIAALIDQAGIAGERIYAKPSAQKRYVLRGGHLIPLPMTPLSFLSTDLFSWRAKLALLREPFIAPAAGGDEETVAQFVRRRLGQEFLDYAIDPFVAGVYAGDPQRLALRAAFPRLFEIEQRYGSLIRAQLFGIGERRRSAEKSKQAAPMLSFRNGMQTLTDALARGLQRVHLLTSATELQRGDGGVWMVSAQARDEPLRLRAAAVVVATPADAAARLLELHDAGASAALDAMVYPPVASVACAYDRAKVAHALDGFGFLVPQVERRRILGSIFSSSLFDGRAADDAVLVTSFVGGLRQPDLALESEQNIAATVRAELAALLGTAAAPRWTRVTRWPRAIPQYTLGHQGRMAALEACEQALPGLFFCANYRGGISVGDCIKSAHGVAARIVAHLDRVSPHSAHHSAVLA